MVRLLLAGLVVATVAGPVLSADPDRARKARVALALSSPDVPPPVADARAARVAAALKAACPCPGDTCPCPGGACETGLCVPAAMPAKPAPKEEFTPEKAAAPRTIPLATGDRLEERDFQGWRVLVKCVTPGGEGVLVRYLYPLTGPPPPRPPSTSGYAIPINPFGGYCPPDRA